MFERLHLTAPNEFLADVWPYPDSFLEQAERTNSVLWGRVK